MASIRRKPDTQYWYACFTDSAGIQRQRSTKTTNGLRALKIAREYEEAYASHKTEAQMRRVLSSIHKELHGKPIESITLKDYVETWKERVRLELKPRTFERYESSWSTFSKISEEISLIKGDFPDVMKVRIDKITTQDLLRVRNLMAKRFSASTVNLNFKPVNSLFRSALEIDGLIDVNVAARIQKVRETNSLGEGRRAFTMDELTELIKTAEGEWRDMILLAFYTGGQRLGDYARLRARAIDLRTGVFTIETGKTGRTMIIPIAPQIIPQLAVRLRGKQRDDAVFPEAFSKLQKSSSGPVSRLSSEFSQLLFKAKLRDNPSDAKASVKGRRIAQPLSFHSLRHTATSLMKNAGVSNSIVMDIVGHDSEAVSKVYTHIDDKTKREALAKLPNLV